MNRLYTTIDHLVKWGLSNENIGTVEFVKQGKMDLNKKNIYPLMIVNYTGSDKTSPSVNYYNFEIGVFDQRDVSNDVLTYDKINHNDDYIDNLNITDAIIDQMLEYLRNNDSTIELSKNTSSLPMAYTSMNLLDGNVINLTLSIPRNYQC